MSSLDLARHRLAARQQSVLEDLLHGRTPAGFGRAGTALTTRVLLRKRSDAALRIAPELEMLPGWRERFHDYAAQHPLEGCPHTDLDRFLVLGEGEDLRAWRQVHEVHEGIRSVAWSRLGGRRVLVIGIGDRLWTWRRRTTNSTTKERVR